MTEEKEVSPRALPLRIRSPTLTSDMGRVAPDGRVTSSVPAKQLLLPPLFALPVLEVATIAGAVAVRSDGACVEEEEPRGDGVEGLSVAGDGVTGAFVDAAF